MYKITCILTCCYYPQPNYRHAHHQFNNTITHVVLLKYANRPVTSQQCNTMRFCCSYLVQCDMQLMCETPVTMMSKSA